MDLDATLSGVIDFEKSIFGKTILWVVKFTKQIENEYQYVHILHTHLETTLNGAFFETTIFLENVPHKAHLKGINLMKSIKMSAPRGDL